VELVTVQEEKALFASIVAVSMKTALIATALEPLGHGALLALATVRCGWHAQRAHNR
jgi:hypothetical protein